MSQQCSDIDKCLLHISHYGPTHLSREINRDATNLNYIWDTIRDWAQIEAIGKSHLTYHDVRISYDPETISHQDFFHKLLHIKEDCLLIAGGNINFKGAAVAIDEDLTPCNRSDVVLDLLDAIGGTTLIHHVFHTFNMNLAMETLYDINKRIIDNIKTLMMEAENTSELAK